MADPQALPIISQVESGNRNIPGPTTDSGQAQGDYQITTGTWKDFAPRAGVDLAKYPIPLLAPKEVQGQVASVIPLQRWAPSTVQAVNAMGLDGGAAGASDALGTNRYGFINPLIGKMEQNQADSDRATAPIRDRMQKQLGEDMERVHKAADSVEPVDIQKWTTPPPKSDPIDGFGSIGAVFAGIASAFTHTPAINAMNGMAAAIEARKEGNETAYKQAYQAWKDNTELAIKRNEVQSKAFTQALDLMQTDVAAGHAALVSAASVYGDRNALLAAEGGLYGKVAEAQTARDRMMEVWGRQKTLLERGQFDKPVMANVDDGKGGTKMEMVQLDKDGGGYVTVDGRQPVSGVKSIVKDPNDITDPTDPTVTTTSQAIANYQQAPLSGFVLKSKFGQLVMADVMKQNPAYDAKQYGAMALAERQFFGGQEGRQTRSMNVAIAHLDTFSELADALKNGDTPRINAISQRIAQETGQSAPTNFDMAKQIIGQEITKAIVAGGGGVTERQEMSEHLSRAASPEQLQDTINIAQRLLAGQLGGLRHQYETTTNKTNYDDFLSPRAKQLLGSQSEASQQARPGDGATPVTSGATPAKTESAAAAPGAVPVLADKASYDALPSGSHYRKQGDPPDSYRTKP